MSACRAVCLCKGAVSTESALHESERCLGCLPCGAMALDLILSAQYALVASPGMLGRWGARFLFTAPSTGVAHFIKDCFAVLDAPV